VKQINTPRDFDAMLQAERAVVLIFFPWSNHAAQSEKSFAEWLGPAHGHNFHIYRLVPDRHPFSWQWLETVFGELPDDERTRGTVVWLRKGSGVAKLPDVSAASAKTLARITNDCFVLNQSHTGESIAALRNESAPFDTELLKILCCPETHQSLALADTATLDKVNHLLVAGRLQNRAGQFVHDRIEDGLVRADGRYLYPMRRNVPVLLVDEAIPLH
jgi:uncharacterized protein YbaR (Trm112 family)